MGLSAFTMPGRFYRGNLHTHSTRSDGRLTPEEVCRRYKAEGYDFISLTDHFVGLYDYPIVDTSGLRDDSFTTILGAELHSGAQENGEIWHILAVGLPADFAPSNSPDFAPRPEQESAPELAARARAAGAFVAIAHPQWSGLTQADAMSVEAAHAVEVYNHSCAVDSDRPDGLHMAELMLEQGRRVNFIATDDAHFAGIDAFGGWVMVKAEENTPEALLAALKAGHFYASEGPEIHDISLESRKVHVRCSTVERVIVAGHGNKAIAEYGHSLSGAKIDLRKFEGSPYIRVAVVDRLGRRAWSNPIWRE